MSRSPKTDRKQTGNAVTNVGGWSQRSLLPHDDLTLYKKRRRLRAPRGRKEKKENA